MNSTSSAALTATLVTMGRWSQGKPLDTKVFVGAGVYMLGLAIMAQANSELASKFGLLVLIAATMYYIVPVMQKLGLIK